LIFIYYLLMKNKEIGRLAEERVVEVMEKHGFRLLARNYEVHNVGELDAVMMKGDCIYIIEVKSRYIGNNQVYDPALSISAAKRRKIRNTAREFIAEHRLFGKNVIFLVGLVSHSRDGFIHNVEITEF